MVGVIAGAREDRIFSENSAHPSQPNIPTFKIALVLTNHTQDLDDDWLAT